MIKEEEDENSDCEHHISMNERTNVKKEQILVKKEEKDPLSL